MLPALMQVGLAVTAMPMPAHSITPTVPDRASQRLDFRIVIPRVVRAKRLTQPDRFIIRSEDVARGYVDVGASTAVLTSNVRHGFSLAVAFDRTLASRVIVRIEDQQLSTDEPGRAFLVAAQRMVDMPVDIGYRIFLAPGVGQGSYQWPIHLQFGAPEALP